MIVTSARLVGGPFDGKVDPGVLVDKLPELATWAYCHECKREHLHSVELGEDRAPDVPVYLRDGEESSEVLVLYRYQDVDEELDELLDEVAFAGAAASGNIAPLGRMHQLPSGAWMRIPPHPNCRCSFEPFLTEWPYEPLFVPADWQ